MYVTQVCVCVKKSSDKKEERDKGKRSGDTKNGCSAMVKEKQAAAEGGGGGRGGKSNAEADRRKISRGTHGRSVSVAGGWRIGRVAMEKRAGGVFPGYGGRVRPNGKPPFGKFVASRRRTLPRCRRFSSGLANRFCYQSAPAPFLHVVLSSTASRTPLLPLSLSLPLFRRGYTL